MLYFFICIKMSALDYQYTAHEKKWCLFEQLGGVNLAIFPWHFGQLIKPKYLNCIFTLSAQKLQQCENKVNCFSICKCMHIMICSNYCLHIDPCARSVQYLLLLKTLIFPKIFSTGDKLTLVDHTHHTACMQCNGVVICFIK